MGRRYLTAGIILVLLFTACAGDGAPSESERVAETPTVSPAEDPRPSERPTRPVKDKQSEGEKPGVAGASSEEEPSGGKAAGSAGAAPDSSGTARQERRDPVYPSQGVYIYAQEGYEEFCSGPSCDRSDLPRRQRVSARLTDSSPSRPEVTTEIKGAGDRVLRTTAFYSRSRVGVTHVYIRLGYEGFVFENEYSPDPPVEILQLPMREGEAWAGSWEAETSGTYEARVAGSERVMVGGRAVDAFRVVTRVTYSGEFRGTSETQMWVDPETLVVLRTSGLLRLKSDFGGYNSAFQTDLVSGPGF